MPPLLRPRRPKTDSVEGNCPTADHKASGDEPAHAGPTTPMSQGYTSSKAGSPTGPEPGSYLLGYARKQIVKKHEKPVRDQYDEDLKALGEGRKDEGMDRESPKHMAAVKLQEGLKAVQPAIAAEVEKIEGVIISEFKKNTKDLERRSQPDRFTRAEVANAAVRSTALKASLGLPLDGDLTDAQRKVYYAAENPGLTPREQNEDSIATEDLSEDTPVEDQLTSAAPTT